MQLRKIGKKVDERFLTTLSPLELTDVVAETVKFENNMSRLFVKGHGYNYLNPDRTFVWKGDEWFDSGSSFINGYAIVYKCGKGYNFLSLKGELLWKGDKWFDEIYDVEDGFAKVEIDELGWNILGTDGKVLWKGEKWFNQLYNFKDGFWRFQINSKQNFIDINGNILFEKGKEYDWCKDFNNGFAVVENSKGQYNYVNTKGEVLFPDMWFDECWDFVDGLGKVENDLRYNFLTPNGTFLYGDNCCFNWCGKFHCGFAQVFVENKGANFIDKKGQLLREGDKWFECVLDFEYDIANVVLDGKCYLVDTFGQLL